MTIDLDVLASRLERRAIEYNDRSGHYAYIGDDAFLDDQAAEALRAAARERDGLREMVGKLLANLDALDDYMKQPERGNYDVECAVCMNEWLEPEDRAVMEEARQVLQGGEKG